MVRLSPQARTDPSCAPCAYARKHMKLLTSYSSTLRHNTARGQRPRPSGWRCCRQGPDGEAVNDPLYEAWNCRQRCGLRAKVSRLEGGRAVGREGRGAGDQRSEEWPLCEEHVGPSGYASSGPLRGGKGIAGSPRRLSSALPRGGGEQGGGGGGAVGRGLGFHVAKTCLSGRGLRAGERSCARPTSSPPPSRQRVGSERRSRVPI